MSHHGLREPPHAQASSGLAEADFPLQVHLSSCDDSNGSVGDVFHLYARNLFVWYASRCDDKRWLANRLYALTHQDDHGVRDSVLHSAVEFLPEAQMRDIIQRLWDESGAKSAEHEARSCFLAIESLAEQLKDGQMYEESVRAPLKGLPDTKDVPHAACVDIAREEVGLLALYNTKKSR